MYRLRTIWTLFINHVRLFEYVTVKYNGIEGEKRKEKKGKKTLVIMAHRRVARHTNDPSNFEHRRKTFFLDSIQPHQRAKSSP